ncbi:uncharacterized protein LOC110839246 isoform X2 [Zootermopsis nevadensis]|uniref:uncharacterized protein LOC110839246 isoform X2 n=1 Tax=Zootermopsis nevadensis TaxID=136037 RepID=UPI000B8E6795|nr:uncharacterized protein LOC110839246 isoform X2 [Zootermopsis nevadensis]
MSSHRSYVPWNKSGLSSSYSGSSSYGSARKPDNAFSSSTSQYDGGGSGYGRRLSAGGDTSSTGKSSHLSASSYRLPYQSSSYNRGSTSSYLNAAKNSDSRSAATEKRDGKESERLSLRDRYSSGTYPGRTRDKDDGDAGSVHRVLGRSISIKSSRDTSPETTPSSADVGVKADRVGYSSSSLSPYRLYSRGTYSRSTSRDSAPDAASSTASTSASTPVYTPSSLRFGSSSRFGSNITRSPVSEKPPTVFGLSTLGYSGRSISRHNSQQDTEESSSACTPTAEAVDNCKIAVELEGKHSSKNTDEEEVTQTTFITVVTRGTSPTPPSTSSYVRTRRSDLARVIEKTIEKPKTRPEMLDKEIQSDRVDDTARLSRYGVSSRWSTYLDRYPSAASSYSPVSRYTSRYGYLSSRSDDKEAAAKSLATQESSTSQTPESNTTAIIANKDVTKDMALPSQKLQSSPLGSSERNVGSGITSTQKSESDKPIVVESNGMPDGVSTVGHRNHKDTKAKAVCKEDETKSTQSLSKNYGSMNGPEGANLTQVQSVMNASAKCPGQSTGTTPSSSASILTVGASVGTPSIVSDNAKERGLGLVRAKSVKDTATKPPPATSTLQRGDVFTDATSATLSSDDLPDKSSLFEENKSASDASARCSDLTRVKSLKNMTGKLPSQLNSETSVGMKSKSLSPASLLSEEMLVKKSLTEGPSSKAYSTGRIEGFGLARTKSLKNESLKPLATGAEIVGSVKSKSASSISLSSEGSAHKTSSNEGIFLKPSCETGSDENMPSSEVCLSKSSSNEETLSKAPSLQVSCSKHSFDSSVRRLPPPVPKSDGNTQCIKASSSLHSLNKFSAANKDFRKSALNVELPSALQAESFKKLQENQRRASTSERKFRRSNSASSGDSDRSYGEGGSTHSLPIEADSAQTSLRTSKSLSKLYSSSSAPKLDSEAPDKNVILPNFNSPDKTKSTPHSERHSRGSPCSRTGKQAPEFSDSDSETRSTETSSSSRSSSGDEDDEGRATKRQNSRNLQHQQTSISPAPKVSSSDELSKSVDKPPKPPVSPKAHKTEESKSFLMRALAPVANLFKGKHDSNNSEGLLRSDSTPLLNKCDKDDVVLKKLSAVDRSNSQQSVSSRKQSTGSGSKSHDDSDSSKFNLKNKIRKQESGERAWWLDSNPNIPEGIRRIESSTSFKNFKDADVDSSKTDGVKDASSNCSVDNLQDSCSGGNGVIQQSEELSLRGAKTLQNSASPKTLHGGEKVEANTEKSAGVQKTSSGVFLHKNKDSESDDVRPSVGVVKSKGKFHSLRHQQSGELPWWLDSSAPVPEGVKRIQSNTSVNKLHDSDAEVEGSEVKKTEKSDGLQKTPSSISLRKGISSDRDAGKPPVGDEKTNTRLYRLRHQQSGELPWWLDNNAPIPEGVQRIQSNSSINKLQDSGGEKSSDGIQRIKSSASVNKLQDSDGDGGTTNGVQRIRSNSSVNKLQSSDSDSKKSGEGEKVKKKIYKIKRQESGETSEWSQSEGVQRVKSSHSVNKMQEPEQREEECNTRGFPYKLRHQESGEKAWWLNSRADVPEGVKRFDSNQSLSEYLRPGLEKQNKKPESSSSDSSEEDVSDGNNRHKQKTSDNAVPKFPLVLPATGSQSDSLQSTQETGRRSPYDNLQEPQLKATKSQATKPRPKNLPLFIGSHTNIDDILGTAATLVNPVMGLSRLRRKHQNRRTASPREEDSAAELSDFEEVDPGQVRIHERPTTTSQIQRLGVITDGTGVRRSSGMIKLDDTALQLYRDGDYGSYLDLEASISEQQEEFDGFQTNRKNSIVLRTQLSVRVHTIIEKLLNSEGRELRRALFSLKQIFQEDKDLVHEFVQNDGLACLIKVGSEADQNYQNYILRALGQVMLYVDGMNGVMEHNETVQWLYSLIASKFRLVVKTALKLLLVFIEYVETNCLLLIKAVNAVDTAHGLLPWSNIVKLLKDYDAADTELLIYAMTLVNKTLNGIPDQDTYYDQVDALEEQGIEGTIQRYMSKQGTDLDLLRQFQIYEAVLHHEDGEEKGTPLKQLDETVRKTLRNRKSLTESMTAERRKSRRHSTGTSPMASSLGGSVQMNNSSLQTSTVADDDESESSSSRSSPGPELSGSYKEGKVGDAGVTPALRRRRERAERQRSFIREQQETAATLKATLGSPDEGVVDENQRLCKRLGNGTSDNGDSRSSNKLQQLNCIPSRKDLTPLMNAVNKLQDATSGPETPEGNGFLKKPWVLSMMYGKNSAEEEGEDALVTGENEQDDSATTSERKKILQLKRENTVKDLTQKLSGQNIIHSPVEDVNNKSINRIGDMTGLISKAMEGLAKSKSKQDVVKSPTNENVPKVTEVKKSETELHWEELVHSMKRPLSLCDLDFTDLRSDDEVDILSPANISNGGPPPPPPVPVAPGMPSTRGGTAPPPPPPATRFGTVAPPPMPPSVISPTVFGVSLRSQRSSLNSISSPDESKTLTLTPVKKTKKTVKLFWKEVRDDPIILAKLQRTGMIWDELNPVNVDTQKLEHLFESRAKDLITKKQQEMNKNKEIIVLDHKRSNAINIGMTKLPPPRSIKTAILKMDSTVMNREGIEKLLTMLPTEEERSKIQEAQVANPDMPLGSAEQFLLTLASISELPARLKLWAFKLDFENSEKEIAEPLMDLKQGMETLKTNKTFRGILSTLLSIGIFLNGNEVKGFQVEYLAKVPEVKDTVHKHSLLHHLCHMVMEKFPESTDLYSEIGAVTRASKVDFDELSSNILKMEQECKASWDHLKVIAKHDGSTMKAKMSDFLADCAERIIVLSIVHRRVMNRFHKFLLWLGIPLHRVADTKPNEFCRIVSEFSLEYRTTRERVLQQLEKKANHRERNKTRGKMITEVVKFRTKEDRADAELRQLLGSDMSDAESIHGTLPWRRQRRDLGRTVLSPLGQQETVNGNLTDGDDEILESLVKTATKAPGTRTTPRERKRTRHADRKSLRRTLKNGLSDEEKKLLSAYIKGY